MINKSKIKLLIAIPTVDYNHHLFTESLIKLIQRLSRDGYNFDVRFENGTIIYMERDNLVRYAAHEGFTHMLWLDSDMVFSDDIVEKFIRDDKSFVSCVYVNRHKNHYPVLFDDLKKSHRIDAIPDELFQIEGCGFGGVWMESKLAIDIMNQQGTCFTPTAKYGEDLAFCERLLRYGKELWADPDILMGHVGYETYWPDSRSEQDNV